MAKLFLPYCLTNRQICESPQAKFAGVICVKAVA
jgi:hypothetical protein